MQEPEVLFEGWEDPVDVPTPMTEEKKVEKEDSTKEEVLNEDKETEEENTEEEVSFGGWENSDIEGDLALKKEGSSQNKEGSSQKKGEVTSKSENSSTLKYLKEIGLINYELEEGVELSTEEEYELLEESFEGSVENRVQEVFKSLDPFTKGLNNYVINGGDPKEYFRLQDQSSNLSEDLDLDSVENQELVYRAAATKEGKTSEEISDEIEYLKESGKLKNNVTPKLERLVKEEAKLEASLLENQAKDKQERKRLAVEGRRNLEEFATKSKEVLGLKLSREDKKGLPAFMYNSTVKLEDGSSATEMQVSLHKALQDPEKSLAIAKLLKSNFDFTSLGDRANKKAVKKIKDTLENQGKSSSKTSFQDYINN